MIEKQRIDVPARMLVDGLDHTLHRQPMGFAYRGVENHALAHGDAQKLSVRVVEFSPALNEQFEVPRLGRIE